MTLRILVLLILPLGLLAQEDSTQFAGEKNPWIKILNLPYDNIETVETVTSNYWVEGNESKLYVYTKSDGIRYFKIYTQPKEKGGKRTIKEKPLKAKQQNYYTDLLRKLRANNFTNIQKDQLNIIVKNGNEINVGNGVTFRLRYIGYDYYKDFMTYAPEKYIDNRFPGWMERVKLLNLIIDFNRMVKQ